MITHKGQLTMTENKIPNIFLRLIFTDFNNDNKNMMFFLGRSRYNTSYCEEYI